MRALVRAELRRNRRRFVAPAVAVAIAVAFVTVTFGSMSVMKSSLFEAVAVRATRSDVVVSPPGTRDGQLPAALVAAVAAVPGVGRAEPLLAGVVDVRWSDGGDYTAAASVPVEPRLRWMTAASGRLPAADGEIAVDAQTAADLDVRVGDVLPLTAGSAAPERVRVVGVADLGAGSTLGGLRTVLGTPSALARWTGAGPVEIDVLAEPGTDPALLRDRIRAAVGQGATVRTGPEQAAFAAASLSRGVDIVGIGLLAFAAVALVVATIVIANTFAALLAGRLQALALLRCVGATPRQVFRSVLAETAVIGVVASLAGVVAGVGATAGGVVVLRELFPDLARARVSYAPWMLAVPLALGVLVALAAAALPARRVMRVAPLAALRPLDVATARRGSRLRRIAGVAAFAGGSAALFVGAGPAADDGGLLLALPGGALTLVGVLLLGPVVVPGLARLLGLGLAGWVPGRLAVANAVRNPVRAASTSVALLVGVSLVAMMTAGSASMTAAGDRVINRQFPLDILISAPPGESLPAGLPDRVAAITGTRALLPLPGATVPITVGPATGRKAAGGEAAGGNAAGGTAPGGTELEVAAADPARLAAVLRSADPGLRAGVALVPEDVAVRLHLADGDTVRLGHGAAAVVERVVVAAVPVTLLVPGDLDRSIRAGGAAQGGASLRYVMLRAAEDVQASGYRTAVRAQVKGLTGVRVTGAVTQRAQVAEWISIALRVVVGLLGAALVIAVVGIANTLALSVLERSRELAVQRALGMTRRQLRASLAVEALLLALVGGLLGTGLGVAYGWAGARALMGGVTHDVPLVVPWAQILAMVALSAAAGVLAAVVPARRAARSSPTAALAAV